MFSAFFNVEGLPANLANMKRLYWLRNVAIAGQLSALCIAYFLLELEHPYTLLLVVVNTLILFNTYVWLRIKLADPVTEQEFFWHLTFDTCILTLLLGLSGGASNPFVYTYLVPLTIAATLLSKRYTWLIAAITIGCYSVLMTLWTSPDTQMMDHSSHTAMSEGFTLHIFGMWFGFIFSAALIAYFIVSMRNALNKQQQALAAIHEQRLEDERLIALGTLATSTAHELGTPLGTIQLISAELEEENLSFDERLEAASIIKSQLIRCKEALAVLTTTTGETQAHQGSLVPVDQYLAQLEQNWQASRPSCPLRTYWLENTQHAMIIADTTLEHAFLNILNNAADASPQGIEWHLAWNNEQLQIDIIDFGPGLQKNDWKTTHQSGSEKNNGLGIGLFLSRSVIERFGGHLSLRNKPTPQTGVIATIQLPLHPPSEHTKA